MVAASRQPFDSDKRQRAVADLRLAAPVVLPSLLLCDFRNLSEEVRRLEEAGVAALHLDVMDGNFVPNLTYGMPLVKAFRELTSLPLDVHLMIAQPGRYLRQFAQAGADILTVHVEAVEDPRRALEEIRSLGVAAGIALNPGTPLESIRPALDLADYVLVMSVDAGFGGQKFNEVALEKLGRVREWIGPEVLLVVDGGVNESTIARCAAAGAHAFVVGSAIFGRPDYRAAVSSLTELARSSNREVSARR